MWFRLSLLLFSIVINFIGTSGRCSTYQAVALENNLHKSAELEAKTQKDCEDACTRNTRCLAYEIDEDSSITYCWLHGRRLIVSTPDRVAKVTTYMKTCGNVCPDNCARCMVTIYEAECVVCNTGFYIEDYSCKELQCTTLAGCVDCQSDENQCELCESGLIRDPTMRTCGKSYDQCQRSYDFKFNHDPNSAAAVALVDPGAVPNMPLPIVSTHFTCNKEKIACELNIDIGRMCKATEESLVTDYMLTYKDVSASVLIADDKIFNTLPNGGTNNLRSFKLSQPVASKTLNAFFNFTTPNSFSLDLIGRSCCASNSCPQNCQKCRVDNNNVCEECGVGYSFGRGGLCHPDVCSGIRNCLDCIGGTCRYCKPPFVLDSNSRCILPEGLIVNRNTFVKDSRQQLENNEYARRFGSAVRSLESDSLKLRCSDNFTECSLMIDFRKYCRRRGHPILTEYKMTYKNGKYASVSGDGLLIENMDLDSDNYLKEFKIIEPISIGVFYVNFKPDNTRDFEFNNMGAASCFIRRNRIDISGKSTWQSSTSQIATLANDGLNPTCSATMVEDEPWWVVDMGEEKVVTDVSITSDDSYKERLQNVIVGVSNDQRVTMKPTNQLYTECGRHPSKPGVTDIGISCRGAMPPSRYLVIVLPTRNSLQLCEVKVYTKASST